MADIRAAIVEQCEWGIEHAANLHYPPGDIRTQSMGETLTMWDAHRLPQTLDCTQFIGGTFHAAGAPDPTDTDWGATGAFYTGTILDTLPLIPQGDLEPGDIVIFGSGNGDHGAVILEPGFNPILASMGSEIGPLRISFTDEQVFHEGQEVRWLRAVPKAPKKTFSKWQWRVLDKDGKQISHAHGIARWAVRHQAQIAAETTVTFTRTGAHDSAAAMQAQLGDRTPEKEK